MPLEPAQLGPVSRCSWARGGDAHQKFKRNALYLWWSAGAGRKVEVPAGNHQMTPGCSGHENVRAVS